MEDGGGDTVYTCSQHPMYSEIIYYRTIFGGNAPDTPQYHTNMHQCTNAQNGQVEVMHMEVYNRAIIKVKRKTLALFYYVAFPVWWPPALSHSRSLVSHNPNPGV